MGRSPSNFIAFLSTFSLRYKEALGRRDWGRGLWQSLPCPCMVMYTIQLGPRNAGWNVCILPYHYQLFLLNSSRLLTRLAWLARSRTLITKETKNKRNCQPIICFKSASEAYHFPFFESRPNLALFIIYCIGSLGGTFGLFLGMSLLTILEFLDFIFTRICHLLQGLHSGNRHTGTIDAEFWESLSMNRYKLYISLTICQSVTCYLKWTQEVFHGGGGEGGWVPYLTGMYLCHWKGCDFLGLSLKTEYKISPFGILNRLSFCTGSWRREVYMCVTKNFPQLNVNPNRNDSRLWNKVLLSYLG